MKKTIITLLFILAVAFLLSEAIIIERNEGGMVSQEIYYNNMFLEVENDRIISMWDFNTFELTMINHDLRIFTVIDYESFKREMQQSNQREIESELEQFSEERLALVSTAMRNLYRTMRPAFMIADSLYIAGFQTMEFHIFNGDAIVQRIWVSRTLQDKIDDIVPRENIRKIENIFLNNRDEFFSALHLELDPVNTLVEMIQGTGYVMRRIDFGLRDTENPEQDRIIESTPCTVTNIYITRLDRNFINYHSRFRRLNFHDFQYAVIRDMEMWMR
jgi:hypothetical protein